MNGKSIRDFVFNNNGLKLTSQTTKQKAKCDECTNMSNQIVFVLAFFDRTNVLAYISTVLAGLGSFSPTNWWYKAHLGYNMFCFVNMCIEVLQNNLDYYCQQ